MTAPQQRANEVSALQNLIQDQRKPALEVLQAFGDANNEIRSAVEHAAARLHELVDHEVRRAIENAMRASLYGEVVDGHNGASASLNVDTVAFARRLVEGIGELAENDSLTIPSQSSAGGQALGSVQPQLASGAILVAQPEGASLSDTEQEDQQEDDPEAGERLYQGTVHIHIVSNGCTRHMAHLVSEIWQNPRLRLRHISGAYDRSVADGVIELREPLALAAALRNLDTVAEVFESETQEGREITVRQFRCDQDAYNSCSVG